MQCKLGVEPSVGCTKRHPGTPESPLVVREPIRHMVAWGRQVRPNAEGKVEEQVVCVAVGIMNEMNQERLIRINLPTKAS